MEAPLSCRRAWCGMALVLALAGPSAHADPSLGGHVDIGMGGCNTEPYVVGAALGGTLGIAVGPRVGARARAMLDMRATAGWEFPPGRVPTSRDAGRQALVTALAAFELGGRRAPEGIFLGAGLGVGHSMISHARGPLDSPDYGRVTLENRTGAAYGFGLGYRISDGRGPFLLELAVRQHGVLRDGLTRRAYASLFTAGIAF